MTNKELIDTARKHTGYDLQNLAACMFPNRKHPYQALHYMITSNRELTVSEAKTLGEFLPKEKADQILNQSK